MVSRIYSKTRFKDRPYQIICMSCREIKDSTSVGPEETDVSKETCRNCYTKGAKRCIARSDLYKPACKDLFCDSSCSNELCNNHAVAAREITNRDLAKSFFIGAAIGAAITATILQNL